MSVNYQELNNLSIQIADFTGNTIKTMNLNSNKDGNHRVDTSSWSRGIYFVSLVHDEKIMETLKVVIE